MAKGQSGRGGQSRRGGSKRSGTARSGRPQQTNRHFPRTARLNALLLEIVADFFERTEDERIDLVTVAGVQVDNDLNRAQVFVSGLLNPAAVEAARIEPSKEGGGKPGAGLDEDELMIEILGEHRRAVQTEIARQARLRKTPEIVFTVDPAMRAGARIEEILNTLEPMPSRDSASDGGPVDDRATDAGLDDSAERDRD